MISGKTASKDKIILKGKNEKPEKEEIVEDDHKVAEILNEFFSNIITNLNLPQFIDPLINTEDVKDPV